MRYPKLIGSLFTALLLAGSVGCGEKKTETVDIEKAFTNPKVDKEDPASAKAAAPQPAVAAMFKDSVAAVKKEDFSTALDSLAALRVQPDLTVDQRMAAQDLMGKVQTELANRADRGDKAAQAALDRYRGGKRR